MMVYNIRVYYNFRKYERFYKMKNRTIVSLIICFCLLLSLTFNGCNKNGDSSDAKSGSDILKVMTSFYPVYISTINVTKGVEYVDVINMVPDQTGCLHDYQLRPADLTLLEKADVFIVNGAGMESFLDDVINREPGLDIIDPSEGVDLINDNNGVPNPHYWVDISNTMTQVKNIADGLALADPKNAIVYKRNASIYLSELSALRSWAQNELSSLKTRDLVTFHEAFSYFAEEFNFNIASVIEREPGT